MPSLRIIVEDQPDLFQTLLDLQQYDVGESYPCHGTILILGQVILGYKVYVWAICFQVGGAMHVCNEEKPTYQGR